jgi:hypothetical protein
MAAERSADAQSAAETTAHLEDETRAVAASAQQATEREASGAEAPSPTNAAADSRPHLAVPLDAPDFHVVGVDLGKSVDGANKIASPTTSFAPSDTIYASIATEGVSPSVKLDARWTTTAAELVAEDTQTFSPKGPARAEFHVAHPRGWPAGQYRLEIGVDGAVVETREFEVKPPAPPGGAG